jgi:hypothetical protein
MPFRAQRDLWLIMRLIMWLIMWHYDLLLFKLFSYVPSATIIKSDRPLRHRPSPSNLPKILFTRIFGAFRQHLAIRLSLSPSFVYQLILDCLSFSFYYAFIFRAGSSSIYIYIIYTARQISSKLLRDFFLHSQQSL